MSQIYYLFVINHDDNKMPSIYKEIKRIVDNSVIDLWRKDYEVMQATMIYGDSLPFNKLIEKIQLLNNNINSMEY